jgi:hypothetical protein
MKYFELNSCKDFQNVLKRTRRTKFNLSPIVLINFMNCIRTGEKLVVDLKLFIAEKYKL